MKYCIIFDVDDKDELLSIKDGTTIVAVETDIERVDIDTIARTFPSKMPVNHYNFETYQNGYAKGFNDCLELLEGKELGRYDEGEAK